MRSLRGVGVLLSLLIVGVLGGLMAPLPSDAATGFVTRPTVSAQLDPCGGGASVSISGITKATAHPPGGRVTKDPATGEPTGMLRGSSALALLKGVPPIGSDGPAEKRRAALKSLLALYHERGITSVADRNTSREGLDSLLDLEKSGELTMRVTVSPAFRMRALSACGIMPGGLMKRCGMRSEVSTNLRIFVARSMASSSLSATAT